jgi:hypothetical protein
MSETLQPEDLEVCAQEHRTPRGAGPYRVPVGDALLNFQPVVVAETLPSGRALLGQAGLQPAEDYALFAVMSDGLLEEIRLEETIDLRSGVERFLAFKSDRIFRFMLDGREYHWGGAFISGATLLMLAKANAADTGVWFKEAGGTERAVGAKQLVDLSQPGVEVFVTRSLGG